MPNLSCDMLDGFHASQTPGPNTIPVSLSDKKLSEGWTKFGFETYSRLSVGTSFPASPNHNDLFWNSNELKLYKYDARTETWTEIDWKTIVKASPEWQAGRLRINSSTGQLEISPDGTNWYACIPAVGASAIVIDHDTTNKFFCLPNTKVIIRVSSTVTSVYLPIVFTRNVFRTFKIRFSQEIASTPGTYLKLLVSNVDSSTRVQYWWNGNYSGAGIGISTRGIKYFPRNAERPAYDITVVIGLDCYVFTTAGGFDYINDHYYFGYSTFSLASSEYWLGVLTPMNFSGYMEIIT